MSLNVDGLLSAVVSPHCRQAVTVSSVHNQRTKLDSPWKETKREKAVK